MAQVSISIDKPQDLAILSLAGDVNAEDVIGAIQQLYPSPARNILWDFSKANVGAGNMARLGQILDAARRYPRTGGKTALVAPGSLGFGLARMYASLAEIKNRPVEYHVFHSRVEALEWFKS